MNHAEPGMGHAGWGMVSDSLADSSQADRSVDASLVRSTWEVRDFGGDHGAGHAVASTERQ